MSSFGVLSTGFSQKLIGDILSDIETRQRTAYGPQINVGGESVLGQLNATYGASVAEAWEVLAALYRAFYPDSATGDALDNVAALTGATRLPATKTTVTLTCSGTPTTFLAAGRVVSIDGPGDRFVSTADATIGVGGTVDVPFEAEEFGVIPALADDTYTIETPVSGWTSAAAPLDGVTGRALETDAAFRERREQLIRAQGAATVEAIRADLLAIDTVLQVFVYENVSLVTDGRNLPPKSIEAIVNSITGSSDDVEIATQLFNSKAAGIETYGHTGQKVTETVTDSMGIDHEINFTRPDPIDIFINLEIDVNSAAYPSNGDEQIKEALVALGNTLGLGETVYYERFQAEVFTVSGVVDCPLFEIKDSSPPTGGLTNLTFTERQIAAFDTSRITVTSTPL